MCGLSDVIWDHACISSHNNLGNLGQLMFFSLTYFNIQQDSVWAGGGRYENNYRKEYGVVGRAFDCWSET